MSDHMAWTLDQENSDHVNRSPPERRVLGSLMQSCLIVTVLYELHPIVDEEPSNDSPSDVFV